MKSFTRRQSPRPVPRYAARPEASRRAAKRAALRHQIHWAHLRAQTLVWILAGGHRVGWFTGDGLGARCPDGSVCHVDYRDMRAMLAGHPALDAADAMRDSYDAARSGQGTRIHREKLTHATQQVPPARSPPAGFAT